MSYRRQMLSGGAAHTAHAAHAAHAPWSSCKATCSTAAGRPAGIAAGCLRGKLPQDAELEAMLMVKCQSGGEKATSTTLRRQHREMLRKLKGCMERTGADRTPTDSSTCKLFEKDASKFSARKVSSGGHRSPGGLGPAFWASLGSPMMGLLMPPCGLTPRSGCSADDDASSVRSSPRSSVSEGPADSEASLAPDDFNLGAQGSRVSMGAIWVASLCILVSVLTRVLLMAEVFIATWAPGRFSTSRALRASEDAERLDGVLRTLILASCSFLAGMGLSALRPEVSALHSVLALGT